VWRYCNALPTDSKVAVEHYIPQVIPSRQTASINSLTATFSRDTFCLSHRSEMSRASSAPLTGRTRMTPQGRIAPEACFIGIRAEGDACESNTDHASRFLRPYLQQINGLLTRDKLRQKCIREEVCGKHFTNLPPALLLFQFPKANPCNADPTRAPVNVVLSRPTEAPDLERHASQRGCNFHSPELKMWSELCHVPSAEQAGLAERNINF